MINSRKQIGKQAMWSFDAYNNEVEIKLTSFITGIIYHNTATHADTEYSRRGLSVIYERMTHRNIKDLKEKWVQIR